MKFALLLTLFCGLCAGQQPFTAAVGKSGSSSPTTRPHRKGKKKTAAQLHSKMPGKQWKMVTNRGTWMNLDLSPDGKTIVFELLGHIYKMSSKGGTATRLTHGTSYNSQPRFSPDGKSIAYTSDRNGCKNIWLMDPNGKNLRPLTRSKWVVFNLPAWSPDGRMMLYRRRVTDRRSVGTVALWMVHLLGGKGISLTNRRRIGDANSPAWSPDGKYIYFASRGRHRYNRNPHRGIWTIQRLELKSMKRLVVSRNASKPLPSPNGRWLAYIRRIGSKTALLLQDLRNGSERILTTDLEPDQQEGFAMSGTYPNYAWSRDNRFLVITAQGQFWKVDTKTGKRTNIPFQATIQRKITHAVRVAHKLPRKHFQPRVLRWPTLSPDGKWLLWGSLSQLWKAPWPALTPVTAVTKGNTLHYAPSFSKDGRWLLYVSWSDKNKGHLWKRSFLPNGSLGAPIRLSTLPGMYANPVFSPDGQKVAYVRGSGVSSRGLPMGYQPWLQIRLLSLKTGKDTLVTRVRNRGALSRMPQPQFSKTGKRLFFTRRSYKGYKSYTSLHSIRLDGLDEQKYIRLYAGEEMLVSPDEKWVLMRHLHEIYMTPLPPGRSKNVNLRLIDGRTRGGTLPILHLSNRDSGHWPFWGSRSLIGWLSGPSVRTLRLDKVLRNWRKRVHSRGKKGEKSPKATSRKITHQVPVFQPSSTYALTNLRILALKGTKIIDRGVILIQKNRILAVRAQNGFKIPKGIKVYDLKGKTAIPGLIDVHAHMHYGSLSIHPQSHWAYKANLAYGVTTVHDPSASTELVFSYAERIRAGKMLGPRVFSTGFILYGAENSHKAHIRSLKDARRHIRRLKKMGAISVKSYMQPTRQQRQWVLQAAKEEGILVYPEGGGYLEMNLSMVLDGHTGIEHALPVAPLYPDVIQLMAQSRTGYTPTLLVGYGGVWGETFFYQQKPIWNDPRLQRFVPSRLLNAKTRRRSVLVLDNDWHHKRVASSAKKIVRAGGKVQIGSHGQLQGLGYHWEMQALKQGGLSNLEVLRAATLHGAYYLGLHHELGSLEKGKLADLLILNRNPLKDLKAAQDIHWVIHNGIIRKSKDLKRIPTP